LRSTEANADTFNAAPRRSEYPLDVGLEFSGRGRIEWIAKLEKWLDELHALIEGIPKKG
jgi:hypothetical protein